MADLVPVRVRDCACPNAPHAGEEGDVVFLAPKLSLEGGLAAQADIFAAAGSGAVLAQRWRVTFVRWGAIGWNWLDAKGAAVPFDVEMLLTDFELAYPVSEKADDLYGEAVTRPLLPRPKTTSQNGSTVASISPSLRSIKKPRGSSSRVTSAASMRSAG